MRNIKKITPELKEFFPYIEPAYGMAYNLKFSPALFSNKELSDQSFKLVFTSVVGRVELEWQMNGKEVR